MGKLASLICLALISGCHSSTDQEPSAIVTSVGASAQPAMDLASAGSNLGAPLDIDSLESQEWLETTSGVLSDRETKDLCPKNASGHFGRYFLIDRGAQAMPFGELTVHFQSHPAEWRYRNHEDEFVSLMLRTDRLRIWDTLAVGDQRSKVLVFVGKRFHYDKGSLLYATIGEYGCAFKILGDTIHDLTITKTCSPILSREEHGSDTTNSE